jgi:hypothetical protein
MFSLDWLAITRITEEAHQKMMNQNPGFLLIH